MDDEKQIIVPENVPERRKRYKKFYYMYNYILKGIKKDFK